MPLNLQKRSPGSTDKVKHLFLTAESGGSAAEYFPYFYVEAKIDFNDVRTGFRETISLNRALEIYSNNAELLWVSDMAWDVDPQKTRSSVPDAIRLAGLPDFVDANFISRMETQFIQYLLRSFITRIYRNAYLNIYSFSGESHAEFTSRCREMLDGQQRNELDLLHDVIDRRIEQLKEKYLDEESESGRLEQAKAESQDKDIFSHYSERIAELFLRTELVSNSCDIVTRPSHVVQELEERLLALESETKQAITKLTDAYVEKAGALDEYILHPNLKDIHFVRSCILWMPKRAA